MRYRGDIDGLRAVAIIPVILFHAGFESLRGGFVGVDVFFVISGFLITAIIDRAVTERRFSLIEFYERRARRIMPVLMAMLAVVAAAGAIWLAPRALTDLGKSLAATTLFGSNIYFWRSIDYFFSSWPPTPGRCSTPGRWASRSSSTCSSRSSSSPSNASVGARRESSRRCAWRRSRWRWSPGGRPPPSTFCRRARSKWASARCSRWAALPRCGRSAVPRPSRWRVSA